jgi:hypothetical protein
MSDRRHRRPLPMPTRREFARHMGRGILVSSALIAISLGIGVVGYHLTAGLDWVDALLNASMILTGMGPVSPLETNGAKLFASAYALFSGVIFIASAGVAVGPVAHRFLHRFHLELDDPEEPVVLPGQKSGKPGA